MYKGDDEVPLALKSGRRYSLPKHYKSYLFYTLLLNTVVLPLIIIESMLCGIGDNWQYIDYL